jgi:hypothetical protein
MEIGTIGAGAFAQAFAKRALKAGYKVKLSNSRGPNGVYFLNPKLPSVIGGEGAGIVEAIGPGVTSVKVGDRVTIPFGTFTWSEKVLAPARGLFVVPPSIDARTASMLNINPTTAVLLLAEFVKLAKRLDCIKRSKFPGRAMPDRDCTIARSQRYRYCEAVRAYPRN